MKKAKEKYSLILDDYEIRPVKKGEAKPSKEEDNTVAQFFNILKKKFNDVEFNHKFKRTENGFKIKFAVLYQKNEIVRGKIVINDTTISFKGYSVEKKYEKSFETESILTNVNDFIKTFGKIITKELKKVK